MNNCSFKNILNLFQIYSVVIVIFLFPEYSGLAQGFSARGVGGADGYAIAV